MTTLTYDSLAQVLLTALPEVEPFYRERNYSDDGPHVVYGDVLVERLLIPLLESKDPDERLDRAFRLIELMASASDPRIRNVVEVTICERLGDNVEWLIRAHKYMGPQTRKLSDEIQVYLDELGRSIRERRRP